MGTPGRLVGGTWFRLLLLSLSLSAAAYAQSDTAWLFTYPNSEPLAFFADDTGNVYIAGWSEPSEDRLDALLLKIDSLGHLVWARTCDHVTAIGAARDESGNIYVVGNSNGVAKARLFVSKYKPNGDNEWVRTYGEAGKEYGALGPIAVDDSQNVYSCGMAESASCEIVRILKYRPNGVLASVMSYTPSSSMSLCWGRFHILKDGGAYLAMTMERGHESWPCHQLIAKLSSQGRVLWERINRDKDSTWDDIEWSQVDENANIHITGHATRPEGFSTMKMASSGKALWTREYPHSGSSSGGDAFLMLHNGDVYVASGGWDIIRLVKYDSLGEERWHANCGNDNFMLGYGQGYDEPRPDFCCMSVDDSGNVYLTGQGDTTYATGKGRGIDTIFGFMLKYDPQGKLVWAKKRPWTNERPDGGLDVTWSGAIVGLDKKGALYDIGLGGASVERGIYVMKYRTR